MHGRIRDLLSVLHEGQTSLDVESTFDVDYMTKTMSKSILPPC